jgi:hypothetical protein
MWTNAEPAEMISTRDRLGEEAYRELSGYYRTLKKIPMVKVDSQRRDLLLAELEKECAHKVQD